MTVTQETLEEWIESTEQRLSTIQNVIKDNHERRRALDKEYKVLVLDKAGLEQAVFGYKTQLRMMTEEDEV